MAWLPTRAAFFSLSVSTVKSNRKHYVSIITCLHGHGCWEGYPNYRIHETVEDQRAILSCGISWNPDRLLRIPAVARYNYWIFYDPFHAILHMINMCNIYDKDAIGCFWSTPAYHCWGPIILPTLGIQKSPWPQDRKKRMVVSGMPMMRLKKPVMKRWKDSRKNQTRKLYWYCSDLYAIFWFYRYLIISGWYQSCFMLPLLGEMIQFDKHLFFRWVGSTTN